LRARSVLADSGALRLTQQGLGQGLLPRLVALP